MIFTYFYIFNGIYITLLITNICAFFGLLIGFTTATCVFFKLKVWHMVEMVLPSNSHISRIIKPIFKLFPSFYKIVYFYSKFFINTPLLTQMFFVYFALPIPLSNFAAGTLVLSLNSGAHVMVIVLEALENISLNHWNTAASLGFTPFQSLKSIFLKNIIFNYRKSFFTEFIALLKESSLLSQFGVHEIFSRSKEISIQTYSFLPNMIFVSGVYFCVIYMFEMLFNKYMDKSLS